MSENRIVSRRAKPEGLGSCLAGVLWYPWLSVCDSLNLWLSGYASIPCFPEELYRLGLRWIDSKFCKRVEFRYLKWLGLSRREIGY